MFLFIPEVLAVADRVGPLGILSTSSSRVDCTPQMERPVWCRFFATAGKGTEKFAEVKINVLSCLITLRLRFPNVVGKIRTESPERFVIFFLCVDEKVFFALSKRETVVELQSVERVFVLIARRRFDGPFNRYMPNAFRELESILQSVPWWKDAFECWSFVNSVSQDGPENSQLPVRFRISCKCSNPGLRNATCDELSGVLSRSIKTLTAWVPSARDFLVEVYLSFSTYSCRSMSTSDQRK